LSPNETIAIYGIRRINRRLFVLFSSNKLKISGSTF
jgi:hypothetical protein